MEEDVYLDSAEEEENFGGLGLQVHPDGYPERNIFEDSCTEEGTESGKAIF